MTTEADEDRELREIVKVRGPNNSRRVITRAEMQRYERLGYDTRKFVVWQGMVKQERQRASLEARTRAEKAKLDKELTDRINREK